MKQEINIDTWNRKQHYQFFSKFDEPFFGITVKIDCTKAYAFAKTNQLSFFLLYLHKSLKTANKTDAFRYRIVKDKVFLYDKCHASPTINRDDGTFGFSCIKYHDDFEEFVKHAKIEIESVKNSKDLIPAKEGENVIHFSSLPWIDFSSLSHARHYGFPDSCPKISFGKMTDKNGKKSMPVSIHVHHALVDGFHVSQFIDAFQEEMNINK